MHSGQLLMNLTIAHRLPAQSNLSAAAKKPSAQSTKISFIFHSSIYFFQSDSKQESVFNVFSALRYNIIAFKSLISWALFHKQHDF